MNRLSERLFSERLFPRKSSLHLSNRRFASLILSAFMQHRAACMTARR